MRQEERQLGCRSPKAESSQGATKTVIERNAGGSVCATTRLKRRAGRRGPDPEEFALENFEAAVGEEAAKAKEKTQVQKRHLGHPEPRFRTRTWGTRHPADVIKKMSQESIK